ncbi:uncharacterized protein LOC129950099 [Eupeodes corollae]|uniref:uncharacterized protein LOC129950099 n=1 Tax=Eupeodes corollae TaxID=290404 RepID=UPI0024919E8C|nr:uncharacterized protein LOC129950099 [Eupeodes corollae]
MLYKIVFFICFIFIIVCCFQKEVTCLKFSIEENHNIKVEPFKTPINKRDISQFFDKASYSFNGLEKVESVPIIFPLDICFFNVESVRHAACLHINENGVRNFVIFKAENGTYDKLYSLETPLAIGIDCKSFGPKGYIAIAYNLTQPVERANQGSPIFQVDSNRIKFIQYFGSQGLRAVYLRATPNDLFLLQTFVTTVNTTHFCPYFKWSGYGFNKLGKIPCSNAKRLEPFSIDSESYVAVANYADQNGRTETNSMIYKYDREKKKLVNFQKIKTYGAVDVKYFSLPFEDIRKQHYLIFGNSQAGGGEANEHEEVEAQSVIYKFEKGTFIPYQSLPLYSVEKFLPVENIEIEKFILLVACSNQEIKIFNMNDWKFEESKAQFTEGALGKGVSNMRIFEENDLSYLGKVPHFLIGNSQFISFSLLVIANERMIENETNVFLPIFTQEEHANTLRQQIIDWTVDAIDRLSKVDVEKLKNDVLAAEKVKKGRRTAEIRDIPSANIEIAYTKSFINQQRNFTASYWKTLSYAQQSLEVLEARANKKSLMKRHTSSGDSIEYVQDTLNVGTLVVRNDFKAKKINGIDVSDIQLNKVSAPKVVVNGNFKRPPEARSDTNPEFLDSMNVEHLMITGKLNDISWSDLQLNTLKKSGQQFLKAPVKIGNLQTDSMFVISGTVSGQSLSKLVRTDGGSFVINQDVQFAEPIYARNLTINDRLNNMHVLQNKLDVLLLNSDEVQHMTGKKTFENVKLLEPVKISGKMFGSLDFWSPFKTIHEPLNLTGDFTITGDVTIKNLLSAKNIVGSSGEFDVKKALEQGLRSSGSLTGLKLNFKQPIQANNSMVSFINGFDLQQLVPTGFDEVQIIEGRKIFNGDIKISEGFAEVKVLNGIEIDNFEKRLLTKDGQQNITGNLKFKKLTTKRITSPSIKLRDRELSEYLTTSGDQVSEGSLKVESFKTQFAKIQNVQTKHKVFGTNLDQKLTDPNPEIFNNYPGTIRVENLKVAGSINNKPIEKIEELLTQLNGNVKYVGGMKFPYDIKVSNVSFTGKFNEIPAEDFGNCWLQQNRDQIFTAPQTLANVATEKGIKLGGKLNGHDFDEFVSGTYFINRDEHISNAVFENSIKVKNVLRASTVNGLRIPEDILTANSVEPQILNEAMICKKDVYVKGQIRRLSTVNNLNLALLNEYIDGNPQTVAVQNAIFEKAPSFITLNSHNLSKTMEYAWFANEDVDLQHHVEIADGYFEGPIDLEGPINGMNLKYLKENYFSLSKPQQVSAEMIFSKPVVFENDFKVEDLHLFGPIIERSSNSEIDFNDFVENSLLTSGKQKVTKQWKIYEAFVAGDLNNIRINNLNLIDDVVRLDVSQNTITAPKQVESAKIKDLYCSPRSTVNDVDLTEWIYNTVFVYENYTILGRTTVDSAIIYSNIEVFGTVNNMTFDEENLLLRDKDQVINGNVKIVTKFPKEKLILSNSIEELQADSINGININEFFKNQIMEDDIKMPVNLESSIVFENSVSAEHFESEEELRDSKVKSFDYNLMNNKTVKAFGQLEEIVERLGKTYKNTKYYLSHFEQKQTMPIQAQKVISLTLSVNDQFVDVIGVLKDNEDNNLFFYRWDFYQQQFVIDKNLSWLPHRKALMDIFRVAFGNAEYVAIRKSLQNTFHPQVMSMETEGLEGVINDNKSPEMIEALELDDQNCFVANKENNKSLGVYCVDHGDKGLKFVHKNDINREGVMQIVSLEKNLIVILLNDSVEIWKPNEPEKCKQKIPAVTPSQIAAVVAGDSEKFIAICSKIKPKSFHHGLVDIYRSTEDKPFQLMQTIEVVSPLQVEFVLLPQSEDILLSILTESFNEPLAIYQYKGVVGFQSIVSSSTLTPGTSISVIHLKASQQHLIAVMSRDELTFIEAVLHKT